MFYHKHPYSPFVPDGATRLIVGTLPPPRFTTGDLKPDDVDFPYGSRDGMLWPIIDRIFDLNLLYDNSYEAVRQRAEFLKRRKMGIFDIVEAARRDKIDASDLGMQDIELRDLTGALRELPNVHTLLFTGGNSKNGPEYHFRRQLIAYGIKLEAVKKSVPRVHRFILDDRLITTVSLTAPSGAANRAVGALPEYKLQKAKNPEFNTFEFRVQQYSEFL
ncbi:uracil-DNA glycosylase family protein [Robertkochia aurantiaca]|uniref:uracil-DNA glycosylase family protein n=1 Tax=Robertkochia aurantiaca TaxID=2873700 RepID=UPI001CC95DC1|nr:uracil-DNA glycosylase family protein [Robertkochia sp. 3YJGBD-33]